MKNQEQKTILLIEDDLVITMVETHLIKSFGYDVVTAISGEEAVQIATGNDKIALILMDVNLGPGIDGPEAAKQILGKRNLPIVFLSSHTDKEYVERIKGIAGYGYVVKDSSNVVLHSSIEMAFNLFMAEEALKEAKMFTESTLNSIADIFYSFDLSGKFLSWNKTFSRISGYSDQELSSKKPTDFFLGEDIQRIAESVERIYKEGTSKVEANFVLKDGRQIPCEFTGSILKDSRGNIIGFSGTGRDITERKAQKEALNKSLKDWQITFDSIPDFIFVLDNDNIITKANFRFAEAYNISPEKLIGKKCYEFFNKSDKPCTGCPYELTKKDKIPHSAEIDDPNIKIPLLVTTGPIFNDKNEIIGAIHIAKDISGLKKAEKEILALSKFPSENPSPVLRIAKDGEILYSNKPGLELLAHWNVKVGEKAPVKWRRLIKEALESAKPGLQEEVKSKIFSIVISPVVEAGYVNLYAHDITERKKAEDVVDVTVQ